MSLRNWTGDDEDFINLLLHHQCDSIFSQQSDIDIHDFLSSHPCSLVVCAWNMKKCVRFRIGAPCRGRKMLVNYEILMLQMDRWTCVEVFSIFYYKDNVDLSWSHDWLKNLLKDEAYSLKGLAPHPKRYSPRQHFPQFCFFQMCH